MNGKIQCYVPLPEGMPVLRVMPTPADLNANGDVFGGWVMSQADIAGAIPAARRTRGRLATVAVNSFLFKHPIAVGDLVSFYAKVVKVGNTSVTVDVQVFATRIGDKSGGPVTEPVEGPVNVKVTEATLTYVAINADGSKRPIPR